MKPIKIQSLVIASLLSCWQVSHAQEARVSTSTLSEAVVVAGDCDDADRSCSGSVDQDCDGIVSTCASGSDQDCDDADRVCSAELMTTVMAVTLLARRSRPPTVMMQPLVCPALLQSCRLRQRRSVLPLVLLSVCRHQQVLHHHHRWLSLPAWPSTKRACQAQKANQNPPDRVTCKFLRDTACVSQATLRNCYGEDSNFKRPVSASWRVTAGHVWTYVLSAVVCSHLVERAF